MRVPSHRSQPLTPLQKFGCGCLLTLVGVPLLFLGWLTHTPGKGAIHHLAEQALRDSSTVVDIIGRRPRIGAPHSISFRPSRTCIAFEINGLQGQGQVYAEGRRLSRTQIWQPNWALYRVWVEVAGRQTPVAVVSPPADRAPSLCPEFYPEHLR